MRNWRYPRLTGLLLLPSLASACEHCGPVVNPAVFDAAFASNPVWLALPVALMILAVAGIEWRENRKA